MSNNLQDRTDNEVRHSSHWFFVGLNKIRMKTGASPRQFAIFGLLLMVAGGLWARPAAVLMWHRLRIITGMPRMALADEDPEEVVQAQIDVPDRLDFGKPVYLDDVLERDPFKRRVVATAFSKNSMNETVRQNRDKNATERGERIAAAASTIQLSGTAKGLGTALLNGRVRQIGQGFTVGEFTFTLAEVQTGAVVLEGVFSDGDQVYRFQLDRNGADPLLSE